MSRHALAHIVLAAGLFVQLMSNPSAAQEAEPPSVADLYRQARRASVEILIDGHLAGSGCFVDPKGVIATAAHVIRSPGRKIEVISPTLGRKQAKFQAVDLGHDAILITIPSGNEDYPFLKMAEALPAAGDSVFLFASPVYRHGLIQRGMVARDGLTYEHQNHFVEVLQIAADVQEGTSGGAWINRRGELIGLQSGAIAVGKQAAGIANVAPVTAVRNLIKTKKNALTQSIGAFVDEAWILQAQALRRYPPGVEGVVVQQIVADGPAGRAGLKKGDIIVAIGNKRVRYRDDFLKSLRSKKPGQPFEMVVIGADGVGARKVTTRIGNLSVGWPQPKK